MGPLEEREEGGGRYHVRMAVDVLRLPLRTRPDHRPMGVGSVMVWMTLLTQGPKHVVHVPPGW